MQIENKSTCRHSFVFEPKSTIVCIHRSSFAETLFFNQFINEDDQEKTFNSLSQRFYAFLHISRKISL